MADPFERVKPGEPLVIRAETWNRLLENARKNKQPRGGGGTPLGGSEFTPSIRVLIQNNTGADLDEFAVVQVSDPAVIPIIPVAASSGVTDNRFEVNERPLLSAVEVDDTQAAYAITCEPIAEDEIGEAVICGVSVVYLDVESESHKFADVVVGTTTLQTANTGRARIIYQAVGTGTKLGVVHIEQIPHEPNTGEGTLCPQLMTRVCLNNSAILALTGGSSISDIVTALQALTLELEYTDCATGEKTCETSDDNCCDTPYALACCPPGNGFTFPGTLVANFANKTGYCTSYPNSVTFSAWVPYLSGYIAEALFNHSVDTPSNGISAYAVVFCDPDNSDLPTVSFAVSSSLVLTRDAVGATYSAGGPYLEDTAVKKAYACGGTYAPGAGVTVAEYSTSNGVDATNDGTFDLVISV